MASPPEKIDRFTVQRELGHGGMGTLYLARDRPPIKRLVAIKVLRVDDPEMRQRFEREARLVGSFQHPNIVTVFEYGEHDGRPFIAMEFIRGETLASKIHRQEPLPLGRRLELIEELCDALAYAHERGVIHRDIKPANLIVDEESGHLKVLDFGIARAATTSALTRTGTPIGTPRYMAPEQVQGRPVDRRCDVFAVGLVLYETLSYRTAFTGDRPALVAHRILHESPTPLCQLVPSLDPDLGAVVERALEREAANRYQDLTPMLEELRQIRQRLDTDTLNSTLTPITIAPEDPPQTPGALLDRDAILGEREAQLRQHLKTAQAALDSGNHGAALSAARQAALVNPDEPRLERLLDHVARLQQDQQVRDWVAEGLRHLDHEDLTEAGRLVDEALHLRPTDAKALALRRRVTSAEAKHRERARAIDRALHQTLDNLAGNDPSAALQAVEKVLALDASHVEARTLEQRALDAITRNQQREAEDRRAQRNVDAARQRFEGGEPDEAIRALERDASGHPLVLRTLDELRATDAARAAARLQDDEPHAARPRFDGEDLLPTELVHRHGNRPSTGPRPERAEPKPTPNQPFHANRPPRGGLAIFRSRMAQMAALILVVGLAAWFMLRGPGEPLPASTEETRQPAAATGQVAPSPPLTIQDAVVDDSPPLPDAASDQPLVDAVPPQDPSTASAVPAEVRSRPDVSSQLTDAELAFSAGNFDQAVANYRAILTIDPTNAAALAGRDRVGAVLTREYDSYLERAREAFGRADLETAERFYQEAVALNANRPEAERGLEALRRAERIVGGRQ
jgi:serine/threonine-protein kinase